MSWMQQLRRASYGGVPFGVRDGELRVGRRNAVHTYPFKDDVWVEDLGRSARRIMLTGFLVENGVYGGGAVIDQREQLVAVCESAGPSTLVHPTLGSLQVSLLDSAFRERWDQGRVFEVVFTFIEGGQREFPSADLSTPDQVVGMCDAADVAASSDFASGAVSALAGGAAVVNAAVSSASSFAAQAQGLVSDATNLMHTVATLPGSYGRFFGAGLKGITGGLPYAAGIPSTVQGLIAAGSAARGAVTSACASLTAAAGALGASTVQTFTSAAQAVPSALLAATTDPGDAIRMVSSLTGFGRSS
jgi:prophage DNA circulation protein